MRILDSLKSLLKPQNVATLFKCATEQEKKSLQCIKVSPNENHSVICSHDKQKTGIFCCQCHTPWCCINAGSEGE